MPVMPVSAAGWRIEPPVSVPVAGHQARGHRHGEPPDEPPGMRFVSQGCVRADRPSFRWRRHGEFVAVQLTQAHGAGLVGLSTTVASNGLICLEHLGAAVVEVLYRYKDVCATGCRQRAQV